MQTSSKSGSPRVPVAAPVSVKTSQVSDVNSKSGSFIASVKNIFSNNCSEKGETGDVKTEPIRIAMYAFFCAIVPIVMLVLDIVRYVKSRSKGKFELCGLFFSAVVYIVVAILNIVVISRCFFHEIIGCIISAVICLIGWFISTNLFLSDLDDLVDAKKS